MDKQVIAVVEDCTRGSNEERISFPQVIAHLMEAGIERYRADLHRGEKTYYMPDGDSHAVPSPALSVAIAPAFAPAEISAAVRASQAGKIRYREFCAAIGRAGCTDYIVSLAGRRALYLGRTGEYFVEYFPPAG